VAVVAGTRLLAAAALLAGGMVALHSLAVLLWRVLPATRRHPLPRILVAPVPELLLGSALVLPLALASVLLLATPGRTTGGMALGAAGLLALGCYLGVVGAALLGIIRSGHR
jgi:hypothetical protein